MMEDYCIKNLFVLAVINKANQLKKNGLNFSFEKFAAKDDKITVVILASAKKKQFNLFVEGRTFCLRNKEEQRPSGSIFTMEGMVNQLFIMANDGQEIPGLLAVPVLFKKEDEIFEEKGFPYASYINPT